jgi:hypothetical protein
MQQSGQNGDPISNERQVTSRSTGARRVESGAAVALAALLGIVAVSSAGCEGNDTTDFPSQGGSSGSGAGRSGAGGTTGGSAGRGGASGASGTGGATAGTGGASGGSAGTGGTGAGTGGTDDGDAGVPDSGAPDADVPAPLTRQQMAEAICARYDELDGCEPSGTCVADFVSGAFPYYDSEAPGCPELIDAYHSCVAATPITGFSCQDGFPAINIETCEDEATAMFAAFGDVACD